MLFIHFVVSLLSLNGLFALDASPKRSLIRPRRLSRPPSLDRTEPTTSFSNNEQGKAGTSSALTADASNVKSTRVKTKTLSSNGIKTSNIPMPKERPATIIAPTVSKKTSSKYVDEEDDDDFSVVDTMEDSDYDDDDEDEDDDNEDSLNMSNDDEDFDSIESFIDSIDDSGLAYVSKKYKKGDKIIGTITRFGRLGMSIETKPDHATGLILQQEVDFLKQSSNGGFDPQIGDTMSGYVQFVRDDGKLDVCLRPVGFDRLQSARESIFAALQASPTKSLDVGDKSSPEMVMSRLPGMSKNMYKTGISALLRDGIIDISEFEMKLIPEKDRNPLTSMPYTGKTPRGFKPTDATTLFVSNFPYTTTEVELAECIEEEMGYGKLAKIKMSLDRVTGRPAGYAYVNFFTPEQALEALKTLNNRVEVEGRKLRVAANAKSSTSLKTEFKSSATSGKSSGAVSRSAEGSSYSNREAYNSRQSNVDSNEVTSTKQSSSSSLTQNNRGSSRSINDNDDDILGDFDFDNNKNVNSNDKSLDNKKTRKYSDEGEDDDDDDDEVVNTKGKWRQTASESPYGRKTERASAGERVMQTREGRNSIVDSYKSKYSASATSASASAATSYSSDRRTGNDSRTGQMGPEKNSWQRSSSTSRDNNNDRNYNNRDNNRDSSSRNDFRGGSNDRDTRNGRNNEGRGRSFDTRGISSGDDQYSVFVGGLPYSATESLVKQSLESALPSARGLINEIRLVRQGGTGESRGYGYVDFANLDTAKQAVAELSGRMILGRTLKFDIEGPKRRPKNY